MNERQPIQYLLNQVWAVKRCLTLPGGCADDLATAVLLVVDIPEMKALI